MFCCDAQGPYRSGKSWLLNQLLGVDCEHGFGVGHKRHTQTRGLWVWSEAVRRVPSAHDDAVDDAADDGGTDEEVHVLFVDTEGFESTRKAAYDDRIFILSTVMASVLIYNLPEAVREADVEKLSFAAELAEEFFGRAASSSSSSTTGDGASESGPHGEQRQAPRVFDAPHLLWLVQRDFLMGQSVQENVEDALRPLENAEDDPEIEQSNRIRDALKGMASKVTAFGLTQPHINRTALCELGDASLEARYIAQREELKQTILSLATPKGGPKGLMRASSLAKLIQDTVDVLNSSKIPNAGNLVEAFNRDLLAECLEEYTASMDRLLLPLAARDLEERSTSIAMVTRAHFERDRYGSHSSTSKTATESANALDEKLMKALETYVLRNRLISSEVCTRASDECIERMERLQEMTLPSEHRMRSQFLECSEAFNATCVGPSFEDSLQRLDKAWTAAHAQFRTMYNRKLSSSLIVISLAGALLSRFVLRRGEIELCCWSCLLFLEFYPKVYFSEQALYGSSAWGYITLIWETIVSNPLVDMDHWWRPLLLWPTLAYAFVRCKTAWKERRKAACWPMMMLPRFNTRETPD